MIEIEKKFLLTPDEETRLLRGAQSLGQKLVEDTYFDSYDYSLTTHDYWLRERNGNYELKAPLHLDSDSKKTNRYNELTDVDDIMGELHLVGESFADALAFAEITPFVTCITNRTSYEKDGFHIDVDRVTFKDSDFSYAIAEIELLIENERGADAAEAKIIEFATSLNLTTDQVILGKVLAYLRHERPDHYEALVAADVI